MIWWLWTYRTLNATHTASAGSARPLARSGSKGRTVPPFVKRSTQTWVAAPNTNGRRSTSWLFKDNFTALHQSNPPFTPLLLLLTSSVTSTHLQVSSTSTSAPEPSPLNTGKLYPTSPTPPSSPTNATPPTTCTPRVLPLTASRRVRRPPRLYPLLARPARHRVNGNRLPPLDSSVAEADIGSHLYPGESNKMLVVAPATV